MSAVEIIKADAMDVAEHVPAESVQCIVTSPPYWSLRKYDGEQERVWDHEPEPWFGGFGLEPTIDLYIQHSMMILAELAKVLRPDGVLFWNLGDSYSSGGRADYGSFSADSKQATHAAIKSAPRPPMCIPSKNLCLIPERFALAAQAQGWIVRSRIIWAKPNPMPESCRDRPTRSHETIWMLTRKPKYYWDQEAVREELRLPEEIHRKTPAQFGGKNKHAGNPSRLHSGNAYTKALSGRNARDVQAWPTQGYAEAHFATYPEALPAWCIAAATSARGCCPKCGKGWVRIVKQQRTPTAPDNSSKYGTLEDDVRILGGKETSGLRKRVLVDTTTLGWQPGCDCPEHEPIPCTVLDPFAGSGTTGLAAASMGRRCILLDLAYQDLQRERLGLFA